MKFPTVGQDFVNLIDVVHKDCSDHDNGICGYGRGVHGISRAFMDSMEGRSFAYAVAKCAKEHAKTIVKVDLENLGFSSMDDAIEIIRAIEHELVIPPGSGFVVLHVIMMAYSEGYLHGYHMSESSKLEELVEKE